MHRDNCFVTLTYAPEHLRSASLQVEDLQKFIRSLRKRRGPVRYFAAGEYGDQNWRPHFHVLLFGQDYCGDGRMVRRKPFPLWDSPTLEAIWKKGQVRVGALTYETAAYTARYVMKKVTGARAAIHYRAIDPITGEVEELRPEFSTMSRRPGIGAKWFEKFQSDVYPRDEVVIGGRRHRPPRFYDERLPEDVVKALKVKRRERVKAREEELSEERLIIREKVAEANLAQLERNL